MQNMQRGECESCDCSVEHSSDYTDKPGHFIRDCPVKNAVGDTGGRKPREGYVCRACGSELHYIQDCPVANQTGTGGRQGKRGPPKEIARTYNFSSWRVSAHQNCSGRMLVLLVKSQSGVSVLCPRQMVQLLMGRAGNISSSRLARSAT